MRLNFRNELLENKRVNLILIQLDLWIRLGLIENRRPMNQKFWSRTMFGEHINDVKSQSLKLIIIIIINKQYSFNEFH